MRAWVVAFALGVGCVFPAMAQEFLSGFADVPLMPGLVMVEDAGIVFDSPAGRIVESYATGDVDRGSVESFYRNTLPAFGWTMREPHRFVREEEALSLDFFGGPGGLTVRFTLAPD